MLNLTYLIKFVADIQQVINFLTYRDYSHTQYKYH